MSDPVFHELKVAAVRPLTDEAVEISLEVPPDLETVFTAAAGQHVTLRAEIDGEDVRRSYSFCRKPRPGYVDVAVKRMRDGVFSTFATTRLRPGDVVAVTPPTGEFVLPPATGPRHIGAIAAGSGITPVKALLETVLEDEPGSRATLIFGNRSPASVMFLEELAALKDEHPDRFHLIHVLSREASALPLFAGRVDGAKVGELLSTLVDPGDVDEWFLCGPYEMVTEARDALVEAGVDAGRIHDELFFSAPVQLPEPPPADEAGTVLLRFRADGITSEVRMRPETAVLDAALSVRPELAFSCRGGMCATCKAKVVEGQVSMDKNFALTESEVEAGFALTCQSHPEADELFVDFDA